MDSWYSRTGDEGNDIFGSVADTSERESVPDVERSYVGEFGIGDSVYTPAFSVLMATVFGRENPDEILQIDDRRLTWWEEDSLVPEARTTLVNPFTWCQSNETPDRLTRESLGLDPDEMFVFSDSGGFQATAFNGMEIVSSRDLHDWREMKVYPEKLVEWQAMNASAGVILDYGPYDVETNQGDTEGMGSVEPEEFEDELFYPNLERSVETASRMYDRWKDMGADGFKLYNVSQGIVPFEFQGYGPLHYIREWYDEIDDVGSFDGWGIGTGSNNIGKLALNLGFIAENMDESHLHFFGTSSLLYRSLIEYWRLWQGNEFSITLDSTSFEVGSQYREFFSPMSHSSSLTCSTRLDEERNVMADVTPCTCSVCAHMEKHFGQTWVWDENSAQTGVAINLHNLNLLRSRHRTIKALVQGAGWELPERYESSQSPFWSHMRKQFTEERLEMLCACMRFVKRAREDSLDQAVDDFIFRSAYGYADGPVIEEKEVGGFASW